MLVQTETGRRRASRVEEDATATRATLA